LAAPNPFFAQVYEIVARIPAGRVMAYSQIARALGCPRAARQVGRAMRLCPEHLPAHRVVMADGSVAGGPGAELRRALLKAEGAPFLEDGRLDMNACAFTPL